MEENIRPRFLRSEVLSDGKEEEEEKVPSFLFDSIRP